MLNIEVVALDFLYKFSIWQKLSIAQISSEQSTWNPSNLSA